MKIEEGRGRGRAEGDQCDTLRATGGAVRQGVSHGERPGESRLSRRGWYRHGGAGYRCLCSFLFLCFLLVCIFYMYLYHRAVPTCMAK